MNRRLTIKPTRGLPLGASAVLPLLLLALMLLPGTAAGNTASASVPRVTVALLPTGSDLSTLDHGAWARGLLSAGMGTVAPAQTMLDIGQGSRVSTSSYRFRLPDPAFLPLEWFMRVATRRAETAPRPIVVGALRDALDHGDIAVSLPRLRLARIGFSSLRDLRLHSGPRATRPAGRFRVIRAWPTELARLRESLGPRDTLIALELPGEGNLLDVAIAGKGFSGGLESESTHLSPLISSVDLAPTILGRLDLPTPRVMEGTPVTSRDQIVYGNIRVVQARLGQVRERRGQLFTWGSLLLLVFFAAAGLIGRSAGLRFAVVQTAVGLPLALAVLLLVPRLGAASWLELLLTFTLASGGAWALRRGLGDLYAYAAACGLALLTVVADLVLGLDLIPFSVLGSNPIGGVRFFGVGNELEAIVTVCLVMGLAAWATARPELRRQRLALLYLLGGTALTLVLVPGRLGADVGAVVTVSAGIGAACLMILRRSWKLIAAILLLPVLMVVGFALIDTVTGAASHFSRTILGAGSVGDVVEVLLTRLCISARTVIAPSYRPFLAVILLVGAGLTVLTSRLGNPLRRPWLSVGLYAAIAALVFGAIGNDSGVLLIMAGSPFVFSYWALALTLDSAGGTPRSGRRQAPITPDRG